MDLDELKNRTKAVKASQTGHGRTWPTEGSVDGIIAALKEEDLKERRAHLKALPFWCIAGGIFLFLFVVTVVLPGGTPLFSTALLKGALVVLYISLAILIAYRIRILGTVDYSEPVKNFLEKARKRHAFSSTRSLVVGFVVTLALAYAAHFYIRDVFYRYFGITDSSVSLMAITALLVGVYVFGLIVTKKDWKKAKAPILDEIDRVLTAMAQEESAGNGFVNGKGE